ncbi:MAG TPA: transcription elongation factor GreA [Candidatus Portnoybacteria bacterium]|nr:transcription elongation factor GreA [Candidatus Portnoybacteria bacterium]
MTEKRFITQEGLEKLKKELADLKAQRREVAEHIQGARELGDLSENAEYLEARNRQAFNEGRIAELENIIKNVIVVDRKPKSKTVQVGSYLKVKSTGGTFGSGQVEKFIIVGSSEASPIEGKISNESPLGRAFLGHKVKDTVEVAVPKGKRKYKILSIE